MSLVADRFGVRTRSEQKVATLVSHPRYITATHGGTIRRIFQGVSRTSLELAKSPRDAGVIIQSACRVFPKRRALRMGARATVKVRLLPRCPEPIVSRRLHPFTNGKAGPNDRA